jgi:SAM-dependent methyltransferase
MISFLACVILQRKHPQTTHFEAKTFDFFLVNFDASLYAMSSSSKVDSNEIWSAADVCQSYAKFRPSLPDELLLVMVNAAFANGARSDAEVALDLGCGSANVAARLAASGRFARVVGVDPSQAQLDAAPKHPLASFYVGNSDDFPRVLEDGTKDLQLEGIRLLCVGACLHWFPDVGGFSRSAAALLRPVGGVLALWTYFYSSVAESAAAGVLLTKFVDDHIPFWPQQALHARNMLADLLPAVAESGSFTIESSHEADAVTKFASASDLVAYMGTWSGCVQMAKNQPEIYCREMGEFRAAFEAALASDRDDNGAGTGFHLVTRHRMWLMR